MFPFLVCDTNLDPGIFSCSPSIIMVFYIGLYGSKILAHQYVSSYLCVQHICVYASYISHCDHFIHYTSLIQQFTLHCCPSLRYSIVSFLLLHRYAVVSHCIMSFCNWSCIRSQPIPIRRYSICLLYVLICLCWYYSKFFPSVNERYCKP